MQLIMLCILILLERNLLATFTYMIIIILDHLAEFKSRIPCVAWTLYSFCLMGVTSFGLVYLGFWSSCQG